MVPRKCQTCGGKFYSYAGSGQGKFCSDLCRFWGWVDVKGADECWEWLGTLTGKGYAKISLKWRTVQANRYVYEMFHGPMPEKHFACHRCDNRKCLNPAHIFAGTAKDNYNDMIRKGRGAAGLMSVANIPRRREKKREQTRRARERKASP